jgi:hypothetical protein
MVTLDLLVRLPCNQLHGKGVVNIDIYGMYMVEYDEIAYSMNNVSLFLVTFGASCEFVDAFYAIRCIPLVNTYMWVGFGTNFAFWGCLERCLN